MTKVTVLVPVYNGARYLAEAIDSILNQSYEDFELLIIDDGSKDASHEIVNSYTDKRIRFVKNTSNKGIVYILNNGLSLAIGEYVARMDADDICHPLRLERQVKFLDSNPDVAVVGTWANIIDEFGNVFSSLSPPINNVEIQRRLRYSNALIHPSVMIRGKFLKEIGNYHSLGRGAEDYDLWLRFAERFELANMPELLLDYRVHSEQISTKKIAAGFRTKQRVQKLASQRCPQLWSNSAFSIWKQFSGLLTAAPGSLGYEYLDWAYTYSLAGKRKISCKLVLRSLLVAPLSIKANAFARKMMFECILGEGGVKVTRWYCNRIRSFFRNGI